MKYRLLKNDRPFRDSTDIREFIEQNIDKEIVYYDRGTLSDMVLKMFNLKKVHITMKIIKIIDHCQAYVKCLCYDMLRCKNTTYEIMTWSVATGRCVFLTDKNN